MNNHYYAFIALAGLALAGVMPMPTQAQSQQGNQPNTEATEVIEVIEVVAQKRKQNIQKVGIAVTALPEQKLRQLGITNTVDITLQVPNFQLSSWSPNLTIFNLRGVSQNSFTDNLEAPIAVYMDDSYVGSLNAIAGQLFDMKQVEILRGPQGTLFGRNATGGLIHYRSHLADEDHGNGYVKVGVGSYNNRELEVAYGNQIIEDVRGRIAVRQEQADGYIQSAFNNGRAVGGANNISLKSALQWDVTPNLHLDLIYQYSKDRDVPTGGYAFLPWTQADIEAGYTPGELIEFTKNVILDGGEVPNNLSLLAFTQNIFFNQQNGFTPVDAAGLTIYRGDHPQPYQHFSDIDGYLDRKVENLTAKIDWDLAPDLTLQSITNANHLKKSYLEDGDGTLMPIIAFQTDMDYHQWSQELRLAGSKERLKWQVGGYYLHMQHDGLATTVGGPVIRLANTLKAEGSLDPNYDPALGSPQAIQDYVVNAANRSLFTQLEFALRPDLVAIGGLRWSQDDKDLNYVRGFQDSSLDIGLIPQAAVSPSDDQGIINYQDHAARLQLNWQMDADNLLFLSYNRGIKVGNWAFSAGVPVNEFEHKPETLHAYEAGLKSQWFASLLTFNLTSFYYDYQDYQAFAMLGLAPQIRNSDATIYGSELELWWQPNNSVEVSLGAAYLHTDVEQVNAVAQWNSPVSGTVIDFPIDNLYHVNMPNAPTLSYNYMFRYQLPLFNGDLTAQLDGAYYGDQYLEVTNSGGSYQRAYQLANLRLSYHPAGSHWEINGWIKNLTNAVYKQYSLDLGMLGAVAYYAQPRTSGISLLVQF